jgi:hypothetical protein
MARGPVLHVQMAVRLESALVGLDRERPHQAHAAPGVREDPHDVVAPPDLLVQPPHHARGLEMLVVLAGQAVDTNVSSTVSSTRLVSFGYLPSHEPGAAILSGPGDRGGPTASAAPAGSRRRPCTARSRARSREHARDNADKPPPAAEQLGLR